MDGERRLGEINMKLAYMTYPLSSNYRKNRKEALDLSLKIMEKNPDLFIIIAHTTTQTSEKVEKYRSLMFDLAIIQKSDMVILGKPLDYNESAGCCWEYGYARILKKPIFTAHYLLGLTPKPHFHYKNLRQCKDLDPPF